MLKLKTMSAILLLFCASVTVHAAATGVLTGIVTDSETGEVLPGANIILQGTGIGTSSNLDGIYRLPKVPAGNFNIVITYIGYKTKYVSVSAMPGKTIRQNIKLEFDVVEGEEIVVTAQLEGQSRAINQQLSANTIVNIVSPDKIQELPDQNAAESLGRLPGISVQRDAGEGQKIIVRGLAPKFNSITVNGERIPSTDPEDRSVDLSMISPDVLAGIEVFKSLTPDKDADAVGGTVNFVVRKAPEGLSSNIRLQTGYNDQEQEYGQYKNSLSLSNRYLDNKLGVLVTGTLQRANRSSDVLDAGYLFKREQREGEERALVEVDNLNLGDIQEIRKRYGASLTMDYDLPNGDLLLSSFWGRTDRDETRRRKRYNIEAARVEYDLRDRQIETNLYTNSLTGKHTLWNMDLNWRTSYSSSRQETPFSHYARFFELGGFNNNLIDDQGPELIPLGAKNNLDETFFKRSIIDGDDVKDRDYTAQLDFKMPFTFGSNINGYIKFGGKHRDKKRDRDKSRVQTDHFGINELGAADTLGLWDLTSGQKIQINNFIDPNFEAKDFLNGAYDLPLGLDVDKVNNFYDTYKNYSLSGDPVHDPFYIVDLTADLEDYSAGEEITSGYLMTEINIGNKLMLLPGFRFEQTQNDYKSIFGTPRQVSEGQFGLAGVTDTTGYRKYDDLLPMIHVRYKATSWFDLRLAFTKTLSRPNYFNLVPWQRIEHLDQLIERGDPNLNHTTVRNYDAYLSFYNRLGLLTFGAFYKELDDVDYIRTSRIVGGTYNGYTLVEPENAMDESTVKGYEIELQTNLRLLPSPFDGIVIYANYSHISSETYYPFLKVEQGEAPFFIPTFTDTARVGQLPGQADDIANLSLGYEKAGFSGRISMVYQGKSLITIGTRDELDGYSDDFVRWDLAMQQKLGGGISLYLNINNISNRSEGAFLGIESYPTSKEYFGWTSDFGIRYQF